MKLFAQEIVRDIVGAPAQDEICLLHDSELEAFMARTIRDVTITEQIVLLVMLSVSLPNYKDVTAFLRVDRGHTSQAELDNQVS